MADGKTCSACGGRVDDTSAEGLCPRCLIGLATEGAEDETAPASWGGSDWEGREIGKHLVLEEIGRGGMGVVYRAYHRELRCCVALKVIRSGALASADEIQRLRKEALAASRLQHPNIVRVQDVGEQDGQHYFTMDFVAGVTLAANVREHSLPSDEAARWVATLARAVAYAHGQRVVHRDLKPGNVLIDAEGRLHLTDFGLAKLLEFDEDPTVSGVVLGTPGYMSPKQAVAKRGAVGEATDIYALGAILYELLTGRVPFRAETPVGTLKQVLEMEPAAPRLLNRNVPRDLETICLKCLSKQPAGPYATATDLADELERYLPGRISRPRHCSWIAAAVFAHAFCRRYSHGAYRS